MANQTFDLGTFSTVPLSAIAGDANGDAVSGLPTGWSVDDAATITLTDNGDGTAVVVRATAGAGTATVTATVTNPDGTSVSGTLTLTLSAQVAPPADAVDVTIVPGTPS